MRISREARILLAIVAVAAAAWVWINFYTQPASSSGGEVVGSDVGGVEAANTPDGVARTEAAQPDVQPDAAVSEESDAPAAGLPDAAETGERETSVAEDAPSDAAATAAPLTARDVEVVELPFLITSPPPEEEEDPLSAASELELSRPTGELRVTINPFSPILLAPPPQAEREPEPQQPVEAAPADPNVITEVPIPAGPPSSGTSSGATVTTNGGSSGASSGANAATSTTATAAASAEPARIVPPTPRTLTPNATFNGGLPRDLPGGTLAATPDILRSTRASTSSNNPNANLASVAALSVPAASSGPSLSEARPEAEAAASSDDTPLPVPLALGSTGISASAEPLSAGSTALSRYLRDNNYRFTGAVVGPVGVGVFRISSSSSPIVVPLGQSLPETDIVLTSLQGKQAEFTQEDDSQVLVLDLR